MCQLLATLHVAVAVCMLPITTPFALPAPGPLNGLNRNIESSALLAAPVG